MHKAGFSEALNPVLFVGLYYGILSLLIAAREYNRVVVTIALGYYTCCQWYQEHVFIIETGSQECQVTSDLLCD